METPFSNLASSLDIIRSQDLTYGELIGSGSYGEVYKGQLSKTNQTVKEVAIKKLHEKKMSEEMLKTFEREAKIMASCDFPNIMKLFGVCFNVENYAIVMDFMAKGSLYNLLQTEKNLSWTPTLWEISIGIAKGLEYLHKRSIIHGDLKSLNILIGDNYQPRISDFGLSQTKLTMSTVGAAKAKIALGSTRWMAPELHISQRNLPSFSSDVYALGMVLSEIASKQIPFHTQSNEQTIINWIIRDEKPIIPDDCPSDFKETMLDCIKFKSEDRLNTESIPKELEVAYGKYKRRNQSSLTQSISTINSGFVSTIPSISLPISGVNTQSKEPTQLFSGEDFVSSISKQSVMESKKEQPILSNYQQGDLLFQKCKFSEALPFFHEAAKENYPPAYLRLMWLYAEGGRIGPKNKPESDNWGRKAGQQIEWFKKEANINKPEVETKPQAQHDLATCFKEGLGIKQNYKEAIEWYQRAADQKYIMALIDLGRCYYSGIWVKKNFQIAMTFFNEAANQGSIIAQHWLGVCYESSDLKIAAILFQKAADQEYAEAQHSLGLCYEKGKGIEKNEKQALYWYEKAAEKSLANAQYSLGNCYHFGKGIAPNSQSAFICWQKAANQDHPDARYNLGVCYEHGNGIEKNEQTAFNIYQKLANENNMEGQFAVAICYEHGKGVNKNEKEALNWYHLSANQGYSSAQYNLGLCYLYGIGMVDENAAYRFNIYDKTTAKIWFEKAAKQGHVGAKKKLIEIQNDPCIIS